MCFEGKIMSYNPIKEEFDLFADDYDEIVLKELRYTAYQRIPGQILQMKSDHSELDILDLGCGTGLSSALYFEKKCCVTGADFSEKMLDEAKKRPFQKLVQRDLNKPLKMGAKKFDVIQCLSTLDFVEHADQCITRMVYYLKDDGLIGITVPLNAAKAADFPVNWFSPEAILTICSDAGLAPVWQDEFLGYETPEDRVEFLGLVLKKK